jgi:hypothetical protein
MLGKGTLTTTENTFYTVPEGKRASVSVILCNADASNSVNVTVKVSSDEILIIELQPQETFQFTQLILDSGDTVSAVASSDSAVKLFITGLEE